RLMHVVAGFPADIPNLINMAGNPVNPGLLQRIDQHYQHLSPGHRRIAEFLLGSYDEAALLTSAQLGQRVGVSESAVIRFAQQLGYSGYPELRDSLAALLRRRTAHVARMEQALGTLRRVRDPLRRVLEQDRVALDELRRTYSPRLIESVARQIRRARTVYVMGLGISRSLAAFLEFRLRRMGIDVRPIMYGGSEAWERLPSIGPGDLLVAIGFFRGYRDIVLGMRYARTRGARTVVITDTTDSPLAPEADVMLVARRGDLAVINSLVVPMALLNLLTVAAALQDVDRSLASLQEWDRLRQQLEGPLERPRTAPRHGRTRKGGKGESTLKMLGGGGE
ncbi:MAG: MurR/RpiR family transcriptional regulator, partial [Armatimonadota bacterium]|nr:MurR/RpiR family transcriptional regulator [Armatimonadota bacterium]